MGYNLLPRIRARLLCVANMSDLITVQSSATNDSCVTSLLPLESLS